MNIEEIITTTLNKKKNFDDKYNSLMANFITKAQELVEQSDNLYQIERNIKLNKISLKDYVLNSEICIFLKEKNISNYTIQNLNDYMNTYEKQNTCNLFPYRLALELYENLENIEDVENKKIQLEIDGLNNFIEELNDLKTTSKKNYQNLYNYIINETKQKYLESNIIKAETYYNLIEILNDIFYYYLYGNKEILNIN